MAENRHRFPLYLHLTIILVSLILGGFGILGYFVYGSAVAQIVTESMPSGILIQIVRGLLCFAILFTYPLQLFPIVRIIESCLFPAVKERDNVSVKSVLESRSRNALETYNEEQAQAISSLSETTQLLPSQTQVSTGRSKVSIPRKKQALNALILPTIQEENDWVR